MQGLRSFSPIPRCQFAWPPTHVWDYLLLEGCRHPLALEEIQDVMTPPSRGGVPNCGSYWKVLSVGLHPITPHQNPRYSSRISCTGQDRRSLTSVSLNSSASDRATSSRSVFPFICVVSEQITCFKKMCLPSRVLRRQTHDIAVPYPI